MCQKINVLNSELPTLLRLRWDPSTLSKFCRNLLGFNYLGVDCCWLLGCSFAIRVVEIYVKQAKFLTEKHKNSQDNEKSLDTISCTHVCQNIANNCESYRQKAVRWKSISYQIQSNQTKHNKHKILTCIQTAIQSCPSDTTLYNRLRCIHRPSQPSVIRTSTSATNS